MGRVAGTFLAMLTLLVAQVPWVTCASDCQSQRVSALATHACHSEHAHPSTCSCKHTDCDNEHKDDLGHGAHAAGFVTLVGTGPAIALDLPQGLVLPQIELPVPTLQDADYALPVQVYRSGPPLPATVRRLL